MKPRFVLAACLAVPVALARSEDATPAPEPPEQSAAGGEAGPRVPEYLRQINERLKLTAEQQEKIRPVLEDGAAKLRAARARHEGETAVQDRAAMFKELRAIQQETGDRINPFLTPEQQAEWAKMRQERRDRFRAGYRQRP